MSAAFNLIDEPWLPVHRQSGVLEYIQPSRITDRIGEDPYVAFPWPRPDFNGTAHELLIGLLSTAAAPEDDDEWDDWWLEPPAADVLERRFSAVAHAFNLDGPGPRFLQDLDPLEGAEDKEVATLLIDTPGAQTLRNNADLFVIGRIRTPTNAVLPPEAIRSVEASRTSNSRRHQLSTVAGARRSEQGRAS